MALAVKQIIFLIVINGSALIGLPVSLYGMYIMYQNRYKTFIIKRNKSILTLSLILFFIFQFGLHCIGNC